MSQAKVDQYKEYKKNRKEILAKEKRRKTRQKVFSWVLVVAVLGALSGAVGVSMYNSHQEKLAALPDYTSETGFILNDLCSIQQVEADVTE